MAKLVRIGDSLVNLDYLVSIDATAHDPERLDVVAVHMNCSQTLYFEGPDAEAVRQLVRTFSRFPPGTTGPGSGGPVEFSSGSEVLADDPGREVRQGE